MAHALEHTARLGILESKRRIASHMLSTRPGKYNGWIRALSAAPYIPGWRDRMELITVLYLAIHYIDDVADGDAPLPRHCPSAVGYVARKIQFSKYGGEPEDDIEGLLDYSFAIADKLGIDPLIYVRDILTSLLFDARRRNPANPQPISRRVLEDNFHRLDISGVIGLCLKIFGETECCSEDLDPLGTASRVHLTLKDVREDIRVGLCNISTEDTQSFGILDVRDTSSPEMQAWCRHEAARGMDLIAEHRRRKARLPLHSLTRAVLYGMYEMPARMHLKKLLT